MSDVRSLDHGSRVDDTTRHDPRRGGGEAVALVALAALALGVLTAFGQAWLPSGVGSLANSSGSWSLAAFALALLARGYRIAALCGAVALLALLAGYVLAAGVRGFPSSTGLLVFWGLAALTAGPVLGLAAHAVRHGAAEAAALGTGVLSGVLTGEGLWALRNVAATTSPPYWWAQVAVGVGILVALATRRLGTARSIALAGVTTIAVAATFSLVYGLELITFV